MKKLLAILCAFGLFVVIGVSTPGCGKKTTTATTGTTAATTTTTTTTTTK